MTPFELVEPTSLPEAIALLDPDDAAVRPIAGGTALMLMMKAGVFRPTRLVSLRKLERRYSRHRRRRRRRSHHRRHDAARGGRALARGGAPRAGASRAPCGGSPTSACATWRPSAAISPTAIRTWTCRRCSLRSARSGGHRPQRRAHASRSRTCLPAISRPCWRKNELIAELRIPAQGRRAPPISRSRPARPTTGPRSASRSRSRRTADDQVRARRGQRRDRESGSPQGRGEGARRRDHRRQDASRAPASGGRGSRMHLGRARLGRLQARAAARLCRARRAAALDEHASSGATATDGNDMTRRCRPATGRALASPPRSPRQGHGTRRIHPHHAAARHAARQDLPQHGRARPHQVDRYQRGQGRCPASIASSPREDVRKVIPEPYYGPAFHDQPILAHRQGALRRRAGRGRARRRSARRRGSGAADRRRIRGTAGGLRRGRGRRQRRPWCTRSSSRPAPSPTSSTSRAARAPTSRSISSSGAATSTRPSPRPRTCSSTPSAPRRCCISRSSRYRLDRGLEGERRHHLQRRAGSLVRAHRDRAAARLAGEPRAHQGALSRRRLRRASSTSSSKRWWPRCP